MPCPTHSAPSAGCVIGTGQDVSVDDSRHVQPMAVQQASKQGEQQALWSKFMGMGN